jgi:hypothetical protein
MKKLSDTDFPPFIDTSRNDLIRDFFDPSLTASIRYDRGVGFFSAAWLRIAAKGMAEFAANSGYARWVTSPILSEADWQALQDGEAARCDETLKQAMKINLDVLAHGWLLMAFWILNWLCLAINLSKESSMTNSAFLQIPKVIK